MLRPASDKNGSKQELGITMTIYFLQPIQKASWLLIAVIISSLVFSSGSMAEEFYRWTEEDGTLHYGSTPPQGVKAERVKMTSNKQNTPSNPTAGAQDKKTEQNASMPELTKEQKQEQTKLCNDEKKRIAALNKPGSRIRMKQLDGSTKYLSQQEIAQELKSSQDFIDQACKGF